MNRIQTTEIEDGIQRVIYSPNGHSLAILSFEGQCLLLDAAARHRVIADGVRLWINLL
jgi:hypothetical protein